MGASKKPVKFGIMAASGPTAEAIKEEALVYYSYLFNDHVAGPGRAMTEAQHGVQDVAAIPAITLAADATSTIQVGFRVLCVDYHQPVVLAKELATIDVFSDGRLEAG